MIQNRLLLTQNLGPDPQKRGIAPRNGLFQGAGLGQLRLGAGFDRRIRGGGFARCDLDLGQGRAVQRDHPAMRAARHDQVRFADRGAALGKAAAGLGVEGADLAQTAGDLGVRDMGQTGQTAKIPRRQQIQM